MQSPSKSEETTSARCSRASKRRVALAALAGVMAAGLIWLAVDEAVAAKQNRSETDDEDQDDDHHRNYGYPAWCFVGSSETTQGGTAGVAEDCIEAITKACPFAEGLANSAAARLEWVSCVNWNFQTFHPTCRSQLDSSGVLRTSEFVPALRNETLREFAVASCEDDVRHECRKESHHFERTNLCQMQDIGFCILSKPEEFTAECVAAVAALGITLPLDFDRDAYMESRRYSHKSWVWMALFWTLLAAVLCKVALDKRRASRADPNSPKANVRLDEVGVMAKVIPSSSEEPAV